ncbi:DNA mismatch repair protein MutS, partial [Gammaproteobacteria bacterium]|nr:DNA mismatch repair protein MutS [Gammaproteobacteria bacterium]
LMRQVALIALLAHTGSYVPAARARIGPIDRIFTRIGAADDLASGRSTFMVEMTEMATILRGASRESLVLVDEIGRGTSTFDGLALADACARQLATIGCATLFATHYFELTLLADQLETAWNVHMDAVEHDDTIVFMYRLIDGPANQSYGIQVAKLAGIPEPVVARARVALGELEQKSQRVHARGQQELFAAPPPSEIEQSLRELDPDRLSAREALDLIYQLREMLL